MSPSVVDAIVTIMGMNCRIRNRNQVSGSRPETRPPGRELIKASKFRSVRLHVLATILLVLPLAAVGCAASSEADLFRIRPQRPVQQLEAEARAAVPPIESGPMREPELVDLASLDSTLRFDIRYAGTNNFMGTPFYRQAKAWLQRPAADALLLAHRQLQQEGFGLTIFDAYRPWYVTWMFWEGTPESLREFVADPAAGSRHNRGAAVDLTLYRLESGEPVSMGSDYDEFTERSYPDYPGITPEEREHRNLLIRTMEEHGFTVYPFEWWHFDYRDWSEYPILNLTFEELEGP